MMKLIALLLGVLAVTSLVVASPDDVEVYEEAVEGSEYEDDDYEDDYRYSLSSPDVFTNVIFPDYPDKRLAIGEEITVLLGFDNTGDQDLNVTGVGAFLHSPFDINYFIQNFTGKLVNTVVPARSQLSIEYKFKPDKTLEPLEFWLSAVVDYYGLEEKRMHRTTFINGTIELVEKTAEKGFLGYAGRAVGLVLLGVVGYAAYMQTAGKKAGGKAQSVERGTRDATADEWSEGVYTPSTKTKSTRSRKSKGKK